MPHSRLRPEARSEIPAWLDQWKFSRFVTLSFNDPTSSRAPPFLPPGGNERIRGALKKWDARVNHKILGKNWASMDADRIFAFYSLEKVSTNPHWHGLIRFYTDDPIEMVRQSAVFDKWAGVIWAKLVPAGSFDVQVVKEQDRVADYISKTLQYELYYESFIVPDEFVRG